MKQSNGTRRYPGFCRYLLSQNETALFVAVGRDDSTWKDAAGRT